MCEIPFKCRDGVCVFVRPAVMARVCVNVQYYMGVFMHVCAVRYPCGCECRCAHSLHKKPSKNLRGGLDICVIYGALRIFNFRRAAAWQSNKEKRYQITKVSSVGVSH